MHGSLDVDQSSARGRDVDTQDEEKDEMPRQQQHGHGSCRFAHGIIVIVECSAVEDVWLLPYRRKFVPK